METKIKIQYEWDARFDLPYFALTEIGGKCFAECSMKSFDEAKERLIGKLNKIQRECPTVIPEPEEVEI